MMHEWVCCHDEAANHHLPIAAAIWIIWIVSTEECSNLTQNLMQTRCSIHTGILNATSHTIHMFTQWHILPPWLVQWSCHCLHTVHSSPLSLTAMLHWRHGSHCCFINNGFTFSGQTSYLSSFNSFQNLRRSLLLLPEDHCGHLFPTLPSVM